MENVIESIARCPIEFWKSRSVILTDKTGKTHAQKCKNWKWPLLSLTSIISASTWPNFKSKVSFEILRTCSFQNWPYFLNLVKIWGSHGQNTNCKVFLWTRCIPYLQNLLNDEVKQKKEFFKVQRFMFLHPTTKKTNWFWNGSHLFNPQYLCQFLVKSSQHGQFWNQLVLRIPKPTLALRFDKDLAEILEVEEKASISKSYRFFCRRV